MDKNEINQKLIKFGFNSPEELTKEDMDNLLQKYINKEIDKDTYLELINSNKIDTKNLIDGLKSLSNNNKELSKAVLEMIDKVIDIYKDSLEKAETEEQRAKIRKEILHAIEKAREESDNNKKFYIAIAVIFLAALGTAGKYMFDKFFGNGNGDN